MKLFGLEVILHGIIVVTPGAGLLAYYWRSGRVEVGVVALAVLMLFLIVVSFADRPNMMIVGLVAAPISLALSARREDRPPAWLLMRAMLIALPIMSLFFGEDSLWLKYSTLIPGGVAIRAIGRVVLILLVPAALGLACLVQYLDQRRLGIVGWVVALVCLAEQAVTTDTFDAAANRAAIASLANQVDQARVAFYYHPQESLPFPRPHLDAMWASLETRVPTVNGYSGHAPHSWHGFYKIDADPEVGVEATLAEWERSQGLLPNHIQRINSVSPGLSQSETQKAHPGDVSSTAVSTEQSKGRNAGR
jgi:hypothetical protein